MPCAFKTVFRFLSSFFLALSALAPADSAEIFVQETETPLYLVVVRGEIAAGDAARFNEIAALVNLGFVLLESPGGLILEGLQIGQRIRENGYSTGVAPDSICASACALIWLGGVQRYMAPTALLGFHAAYLEEEKVRRESGLANALVGMYLSELGFGIDTVVFATSAGPDEIQWLNASQAQSAGIPLYLLETDGTLTFEGGPRPRVDTPQARNLKLPRGYRWIVLQSAKSPSQFSDRPEHGLTVKTQNGYYANILGPFTVESAQKQLMTNPSIPKDAYLSSGNGFLFQVY